MEMLAKALSVLTDGINQILFVSRGRVTEEQIAAFDAVQHGLLDGQALNFTTIVRTGRYYFFFFGTSLLKYSYLLILDDVRVV
jgi:hypothetical protein